MSKIAVVSLALFVLASFASAQIPSGNVFVGYTYTQTNLVPGQSTSLNGWNGSLEGKIFPFIGLVADIGGVYGSQSLAVACPLQGLPTCPTPITNASLSEYNFLFGARASFSVHKFRPFVHALVGVSRLDESGTGVSNTNTSLADALGGGLDYHLIPLISWRVQADALQTRFFSTTQTNLRFSTGIVVHF
jgi:hypothetical protein